ncbi:MAG: leucine-rich repeat protein, partial [Paramuribaculum sp.]|nr:leucine-rich repeat protein [Paramuribaculum sp.]
PNSVTSIGNFAFSGCSGFPGAITIPNSVTTIGGSAFSGCSGLTGSLTIPNSVTSINWNAFNGCGGLNGTLIIPETLTEIGNEAFYNCISIDSIICNATIPPHIDYNAFYKVYDSVRVLTVPDGCVQTYRNADGWSRFKKITDISGDEVSILQSYTSDNLYYTLNNSDLTATVYAADVKNTSSSEVVTIPASIEVDGQEYAVTTIGEHAFHFSPLQINPVLPKSIRVIKEGAFMQSNKIKGDLILPDSLTYIGKEAFAVCDKLTGDLVIPESVKEIGDAAFHNCRELTGNLVIPKSVKSIGNDAFSFGKYMSLNILNPDIEMGNLTFKACYSLEEITLPEGLTILPDYTFLYCRSLKQIQLPQSLTSIGYSALASTGIESIVIPESVSEIGEYAFGSNYSLESINLPSKLSKIAGYLLYNCPNLKEITIPAALDSIGERAFECDTALLKVNVESLEQWSKINFANETANPLCYGAELVINGKSAEVIEVPEEVTEVKDYAFAGLKTIVEVVIPEVVEAIGTGSFIGCSGLENIKIPEAVKSIGEKAFKACTGLTSAIIGKIIAPSRAAEPEPLGELATVQSCAFDSCTSLANVAIGANVAMIADSAFINCDKISRVDCYAMLAPEVASTAFEQEVQSSAALHVPAGYRDVYEASPVWSKFTTIFDDLAVAERLTMDTESVEINESATRQLGLKTTVNGTVTWTSSAENVATVNANGVVTGIKAGTAQIIATAPNGARATCTVTVVKPAAIDDVDSDLQDTVRVEGNSIIAPEGSVVYDLNGRRVKATNLAKGIYIVRLGSKAVQVSL